MSRRGLFKALAAIAAATRMTSSAYSQEVLLPADVRQETWDFEAQGIEHWRTVAGQWAVEDTPGAPSVKFYPISGRQDASGGIVFRFTDGKYYLVRANALEDNFRLYAYDRGRRQLASATVKKPARALWHQVRVAVVGDRIQASLNGVVLLNHRDSRFPAGHVGLWTKADSVTAFDDLTIRGVRGSGSA